MARAELYVAQRSTKSRTGNLYILAAWLSETTTAGTQRKSEDGKRKGRGLRLRSLWG